jgi:hypothetical protein
MPRRLFSLLAAAALTVSGCGGNADQSEAPPDRPEGTTARAVMKGLPHQAGHEPVLVPAGRYVTAQFRPPVSLTLGGGWRSYGERADGFTLARGESLLGFVRIERVVDSRSAGMRPRPEDIHPAPADLAAWLEAHPRLKTSGAAPVQVGGAAGVQIEATVSSGFSNVARLFVSAADEMLFVEAGERIRFFVIDVGSETVLIVLESPSQKDFEELLGPAEKVLASVRFLPP